MRMRSYPDHSTPTRRRLATGAAVAAVALGAGLLAAPPAQAADPVMIDLVTVNDFHGRIEQALPAGGIAALANAVNDIRATNPNTVFAAAGDMIGASTFTSFIQDDEPTIDALNLAGLDVSAAGNHEFDRGWVDLRDRVQDRAAWEYIAANVWDTETNDYALAPYWTEDVGGIRMGFIGAVTEELPALVSPAGIATLDVNPIVESVNAVADDLTDGIEANGEADVLVLLVHEGASQPTIESATDLSTPFGKIVAGVSDDVQAIVSGHTHQAYNFVIDGRPVISSGQYGEKFSDMKISVDPDTKEVLSMVNTVYSMTTGSGATGDPYVFKTEYTPGPAEQPIVDLVAQATAFAKIEGAKKVGDITASFQRGIQPRTPTPTDPSTTQESRGAESTLGNFVADVQLDQAQVRFPDTQIAFMNPGGLRADLRYPSGGAGDPDGNVTYAEAAGVQPFANTLVTMTLTGAQLKSVLEEQWQPAAASRPFLKLGVSKGLTYITDYAAPAGSHITNLEFEGAPVDPAATYRVVVNSFLASGGDNFFTLGQGTNKADSGLVDLEAMVAWFTLNGEATPDLAQRSIGVALSPAASANGYEVGTQVKVDLSSLDFTQTPTPATSVTVSIAGTDVGTASIDRTLIPLTDEFGKASLTVVIPEGATGGAPFGAAVVVPIQVTTSTGTTFDVPISVFDRASSTTTGAPNKTVANSKGNGVIQYMGTITAESGVPVTGIAKIYDGDQVIATITLEAADQGAVKLKLPKLAAGSHPLKLVYEGSATVQPSTSATVTVQVK
ncbi:5'-nucleotidase C-terminal domain-containing protein [Microbacterium sp. NPDC019599]|uniref:5'-nucleotidase C-terminal domain-containing protein n=1 Tax=Microbacterium sp. NPDC019599 TaxID=3154690 RepID=UPI00340E1BC3